jgi:hypothetical protein
MTPGADVPGSSIPRVRSPAAFVQALRRTVSSARERASDRKEAKTMFDC